MKKSVLLVLASALAVSACYKNELVESLPKSDLHVVIEEGFVSKTAMDADNNIYWSDGDMLIGFMKSSYGYKYKVKPDFVGKTYADFDLVQSEGVGDLSAGIEWDHNVVFYPYSDSIEVKRSGLNYSLDINLPSEQRYVAGSFGNGAFPMVAVSQSNNITFKNICGGIKLQFKGSKKLTAIKLEGKNSEKLSGKATVVAYTDNETKPSVVMSSMASNSVVLKCEDGIQLDNNAATEFVLTVPPVQFSKGFIVTVYDD